MRSLLGLLAIALFGVSASACGSASKGTASAVHASSSSVANTRAVGTTAKATSSATSIQTHLPTDNDNDNDNPGNSRYDTDDAPVLDFGHAAGATEARAIVGLVKRYYAAAAVSDGATACPLIYSIIGESVAEDYGRPPGPPALRGNTCAAVMSKLFRQHRRELADKSATLEVTSVRVQGSHGVALLRFGTTTERRVLVQREGGTWKMGVLLDIGVP